MSVQGRTKTDIGVKEPKQYNVIMLNDDFTTMEFVVKLLMTVFHKSQAEAEQLMLMVHRSEKAVVGVYSYDVAVSKVQRGLAMARQEGFPLRLTCEPEV